VNQKFRLIYNLDARQSTGRALAQAIRRLPLTVEARVPFDRQSI